MALLKLKHNSPLLSLSSKTLLFLQSWKSVKFIIAHSSYKMAAHPLTPSWLSLSCCRDVCWVCVCWVGCGWWRPWLWHPKSQRSARLLEKDSPLPAYPWHSGTLATSYCSGKHRKCIRLHDTSLGSPAHWHCHGNERGFPYVSPYALNDLSEITDITTAVELGSLKVKSGNIAFQHQTLHYDLTCCIIQTLTYGEFGTSTASVVEYNRPGNMKHTHVILPRHHWSVYRWQRSLLTTKVS